MPETASQAQPATSVAAKTAALILVCAVWGSTFTLVKEALDNISAMLFLVLRFGIATVALWAVLRARAPIPFRPGSLRAGAWVGLALFGGYLFQTLGLQYTTPARSAFLTGLFIVIVPLLVALRSRRLPVAAEAAGIGLSILGMSLLAGPFSAGGTRTGDLLTVACACCYAVHILLLSHYAARIDVRALTLLQLAFVFLFSLASFWWAEPVVLRSSPTVWLAILFTGVFATALAFLVQTWAQSSIPPARTALIFSMEPVFAWITSYLVLGEILAFWPAIGAALILLGVLVVELRLPFGFRRKRNANPAGS